MVTSCAALKKLNPALSCVFYLNTELDFSRSRLFDEFERRPSFWLLALGAGPVLRAAPQWGCKGGACPGNGTLGSRTTRWRRRRSSGSPRAPT